MMALRITIAIVVVAAISGWAYYIDNRTKKSDDTTIDQETTKEDK